MQRDPGAADAKSPIRILLVDDHVLFREGLARLLAAENDLELVSHCGSIGEARRALERQPIDIVLLDLDLGDEKGADLLAALAGRGSHTKVLVLTAGVSDAELPRLFELGAAGIFFKESSVLALARGIRAVMNGEAWIDQRVLATLAGRRNAVPRESRSAAFTDRERQVLRGVFEGLANKEIGGRLGISESSVKAALQQLFHKTGVRTRSQLVRIALEQYRGLL
jgi:DNA-binding NarL/FixJ family response regulator